MSEYIVLNQKGRIEDPLENTEEDDEKQRDQEKEKWEKILPYKSTFQNICTFYKADCIVFLTAKSFTSNCPVVYFKEKIKKLYFLKGFNIKDKLEQDTDTSIKDLLDISPDSLIDYNNKNIFTRKIPDVKKSIFQEFRKSATLHSEIEEIQSATYISLRINNFLNGVICLGSNENSCDFTPKEQEANNSLAFSFNIINELFELSKALYKLKLYEIETKNENLDESKAVDFDSLARNITHVLNAERTHIFLLKNDCQEEYLKNKYDLRVLQEHGNSNAGNVEKDNTLQDRLITKIIEDLRQTEEAQKELQKDYVIVDINKESFKSYYNKNQILVLRGVNKLNYEAIVKKYLVPSKGHGAKTFALLDELEGLKKDATSPIDQSFLAINEDRLLDAVYNLKDSGFANGLLAKKEDLNSLLSVAIYDGGGDEHNHNVLGVMNIFYKKNNPMFNYKRREILDISNNVKKEIYAERAKYYEGKLVEPAKLHEEQEPKQIESYLKHLEKLNKIYNKGIIPNKKKGIDVKTSADILLFKKNLTPYYLHSLSIKDISFFEDVDIVFDKNLNIILGKNGYGKSYYLRTLVSLLQSNSENLIPFFKKPDQIESSLELRIKRMYPSKQKRDSIYFNESSFKKDDDTQLEKGKFPVLAIPDVRTVKYSGIAGGVTGQYLGDLKEYGAYSFINRLPFENVIEDFIYDLCLTFNETKIEELKKSGIRTTEAEAEKFAFKHDKLELLRSVMNDFTGDTSFDFHSIKRIANSSVFQFLVKTNDTSSAPIPIQTVSQGTMSVLAIFGLIYRYLSSFPSEDGKVQSLQINESLKTAKGVVFIDEIDAHLHPSWQQKICFLLNKYFPSVQFFISAHSAFIVAGTTDGQVSVLRGGDKKSKIQRIYGDLIGAKSNELYDLIFEIEDLDIKLLHINSLKYRVNDLKNNLYNLQIKDNKTPLDFIDILTLREEINLIEKTFPSDNS